VEATEGEIIVIGAGLAGLTCAAHLAERGLAVTVLEADWGGLGGRLGGGDPYTFHYQGRDWTFQPEHGVHAIWGGYVNFRATLERFTATRLQPSVGEEWVNRWGREVRRLEAGNAIRARFLPAPFHYLNLLFHPRIWTAINLLDFLSLPGVLLSLLLTLGVDPIKEGKAWDGLPLRLFFRGWTPNLRATFEGLAANLLAAPLDEIDLAAFIAALRFYTVLRRDSWAMHYLPQDAETSVIKPLAQAIEAREGRILGGMTAQRLERSAAGWRVVVEDGQRGSMRSFQADQVVLAAYPSGAERLLLASPATQEQAQAMRWPQSVASVVVRLWFSADVSGAVQGGMMTGDFGPDNFFWLHRLYDDCRPWHDITGGSVAELHFYEDKFMAQSDANLIILAVTELTRAFPSLRDSFVHGAVRRNSRVHPRWRVPTHESLHVQTPWPDLYACGDWVGWDSPSLWIERASVTGIAAANAILQARGLPIYPIGQPPAPEPLVRGLQVVLRVGRRLLGPPLRAIARSRRGRSATDR